MPVGGRVSGKIGIITSSQTAGGNHSRINEEIIWLSVGMGITIAILITIALCYILREKYKKHEEYAVTT